MKATRKLIPALALLLVSAALMSTASYAWFSMNTSVTAQGMNVTAKTDNAYLIISAGRTLSQTERATTANPSAAARLYPVKPTVTLTAANIETANNWGTATSTNPADANTAATLTPLAASTNFIYERDSSTNTGSYVLKQTYTVGIVENSGSVANPLRMKSITFTNVNAGITAVVVCGNHIYTYSATDATADDVLAAANLVTADGVQVDVYIYIDGSNTNVTTNNASQLTGAVTLEFTIDAPAETAVP